jgi:seryl-tRNA synthetase
VNVLEDKLNACDSIYRLAAQSNATREKERRDKHQSIVSYAIALEERVTRVEERVAQLPQMIKELVRDVAERRNDEERIAALIGQTASGFEMRLDELETSFLESAKQTQKVCKKLQARMTMVKQGNENNGQIDDVSLQVAELRRRQGVMLDLLNALRLHGDQDFDAVNSQLTGLWAQLAVKRSESPRRRVV